jgi:hypothetical protein
MDMFIICTLHQIVLSWLDEEVGLSWLDEEVGMSELLFGENEILCNMLVRSCKGNIKFNVGNVMKVCGRLL